MTKTYEERAGERITIDYPVPVTRLPNAIVNQVAAFLAFALDVAAWNRANPGHPKDAKGRWAKGSAVGNAIEAGESIAHFSREALQREVRRRNREGAGIEVRRGASAGELADALKGTSAKPKPSTDNAKITAARERQARIDAIRKKVAPAVQIYHDMVSGKPETAAKLDEADRLFREAGVRPFGMPETVVKFDPKIHKTIGSHWPAGQDVSPVTPGLWWDEKNIMLEKAVVNSTDPEQEIADYWSKQDVDVYKIMKEREKAWKNAAPDATPAAEAKPTLGDLFLAGELFDRSEKTKFGSVDYPTPYEVSQLGRWPGAGKDDMWIGHHAWVWLERGAVPVTTVAEERRDKLRAIADTHDQWAPQNLDAPFDESQERGDKSVYNQHYADLDASGAAQDEYANQVAALTGGDQTASITDKHGNLHSESDGKFVRKGSAATRALKSGQPDSLAGFSREQLQREVRRRNRDGAGIKLRRGATADEIKEALGADEGRSSQAQADSEHERSLQEHQENLERMRGPKRPDPFQEQQAAKRAAVEELKPRAYELMLDDPNSRAYVSHAPSRKVLEAMRANGWQLTDLNPSRRSSVWEDGAGRRLELVPGGEGVTFWQGNKKLSHRAAADTVQQTEPRPGSMAERRAQRDLLEADKARRAEDIRKLSDIPKPDQAAKLNELTNKINDPGTSQAESIHLQDQRRELRRLMGVNVTSSRPTTARTADKAETTKYSNPGSGKVQSAVDKVNDIRAAISRTGPGDRSAETGAKEQARAALEGLKKDELREVARQLDVPTGSNQTKAQLLRSIVDIKIGSVILSRSIERPTSAMGNQTAAMGDVDAFDAAFSGALEAAMELDDDATEDEFSAEFLAEFASRMPERLARYWTEGAGVARVKWFIRGAFRRCRRALKGEGVPRPKIDGACANLYHRATGRWPGAHKGAAAQMAAALSSALEIPLELLDSGYEFAALDADELEELVDILMEEMNMAPDSGTQVACGCGGGDMVEPVMAYDDDGDCPEGSHRMPDGSCMDDDDMGGEMAAEEVWIWEGPLAPIATPTNDQVGRQFAPGALSGRGLPRALRWQERQERGHDGAVVVGALTDYWRQDGMPFGRAYFFDETVIPEAGKARYLVEHGVIAPSVDLEPSMEVAYADADGNVFSPEECTANGTCPVNPRQLITRGTIAASTLVPIAAFGQLGAGRLYRGPKPVAGYNAGTQIASVQTSGWDDLPIASREREWDKGAADQRVTAWATTDGEIDWGRYGQAFLWHADPADTKAAFKFPVADVIDGELTIIPRAVIAAAGRLGQADVPAEAVDSMRDVLSDLYDQIADELDDDGFVAPWDDDREEMSVQDCGCAAKMGAIKPGTQTASAGCDACGSKYGVFGNLEPYPVDAFGERRFDKPTPLQIEQRPGEPFARLFGHIGDWKGCHRGFRHVCLPPPHSRTNYSEFHTAGSVRIPGGMLRVGKVVMGEGHPDKNVGARVARAYYDATSKEVGHVRAYEDQFGPYVNGVVAPGVSPQEATKLLASPPSGDWKDHELIAVLAVNVAGHPVRTEATFGADGQPRNMVAAGRWWPEETPEHVGDLDAAREVLWAAEFDLAQKVFG